MILDLFLVVPVNQSCVNILATVLIKSRSVALYLVCISDCHRCLLRDSSRLIICLAVCLSASLRRFYLLITSGLQSNSVTVTLLPDALTHLFSASRKHTLTQSCVHRRMSQCPA